MPLIHFFLDNLILQIFIAIEIIILLYGLILNLKILINIKGIRNIKNIFKHYLKETPGVLISDVIDKKKNVRNKLELDLSNYIKNRDRSGRMIDRKELNDIITFNTNNILTSIESSINILPVAGLLGTFLGIIIMLPELQNFIQLIQSSSSLNVNNLLQPIVLAFGSSLCGLFFALILKIAYGRNLKKFEKSKKELNNFLLIDFFNEIKPKRNEEIFTTSVNKLSRKLTLISNNINTSLKTFTNNFNKTANEISEIPESFSKNLVGIIDEQRNFNKLFTTKIEEITEKLNDNFGNMRKDLSSLTTTFSNKLGKIIDNQKSSNLQFKDTSEDILEKMDSQLIKLNKKYQNNINQHSEILQYSNKLNKDLSNTLKKNKEIIVRYEKVFSDISKKFIKMNDNLLTISNKMKGVEKTSSKNVENFKKIEEKFNKSFSDLVKQFNVNYDMNKELNNSISSYLEKFDDKFTEIKQSKKTASNFLESINNIYSELKTSINQLHQYSVNLNRASELFVDSLIGKFDNFFNDIINKENFEFRFEIPEDNLSKSIDASTQKVIKALDDLRLEVKKEANKKDKIKFPWPFSKK